MSLPILFRHFARHRALYFALCCGAMSFIFDRRENLNVRMSVASDVFYAVYLLLVGAMQFRLPVERFRDWADDEDEGLVVIVAITLTAVAISLGSVFVILNEGRRPDALLLAAAVLSAPLGWLVLHTSAALQYAHFYYGAAPRRSGASSGLDFPETANPGPWEFLYYSFVVGMTAQVSDVQVTSTAMRRMTLGHSIVSFFFNTVLIALVVNVIVAMTQASTH